METLDRESITLEITEIKKQIADLHQQKIAAEATLRSLQEHLAEHNDENLDHSKLEIEDLRNSGSPIEVNFSGELSNAQKQAATSLLEHENGIFVAPLLLRAHLYRFDLSMKLEEGDWRVASGSWRQARLEDF